MRKKCSAAGFSHQRISGSTQSCGWCKTGPKMRRWRCQLPDEEKSLKTQSAETQLGNEGVQRCSEELKRCRRRRKQNDKQWERRGEYPP